MTDISGITAVVIPVFNNRATLRDVVMRTLRQNCAKVIVVDDGCTDCNVNELLAGLDVSIIRHERNLGKGKALQTAVSHLVSQSKLRWMITLDADGQHAPEDIRNFIELLKVSPAEDKILIGVRDFSNVDGIPAKSISGRKVSNFWFKIETGHSIADAQSGFRCYPIHLISQIKCCTSHYDWETEIIVRAAWAGADFENIPVSVEYFTPETRVSHFDLFKDNLRISLLNTRLVGEALIPFPKKKIIKRKQTFSIFRPKELFLYLLKENNSAAGLAAAAAVGTFIAVLPIFMFHTIVIVFFSVRLHLNKIMMLAIQNLFMPPFSPFLCIELGHYMLHRKWLTEITFENIALKMHERLFEWLCGSLLLAPFFSVLIYLLVFFIVSGVKKISDAGRAAR